MGILCWPKDVAAKLKVSEKHLQVGRANGDAPRLYAATERTLVTTDEDVLEWIQRKEVPIGYKCRPATRGAAAEAGT